MQNKLFFFDNVFIKKTRCDDTITNLIKFYLRQLSFINKLKIVRSLLGLGPIIKEITGKFTETVKRKKW